jgi:hypothetical protein
MMKHVNFHFYRFCFAKIMDLFLSTAIFIKKLSFDFFIPLLFKYCATSIYLLKMPVFCRILKYVYSKYKQNTGRCTNTENPTLSYTFLRLDIHLKSAPNQTFLHFPTLLSPCMLNTLPSVALSLYRKIHRRLCCAPTQSTNCSPLYRKKIPYAHTTPSW